MLFISLPGDGPQNIRHVVFIPLGSLLSSKQSIFKCSHGAPLYTTGHPVGMDPKQIKWSKAWLDSFCGAGERIIWSVVGWRTLRKNGGVNHPGCVFSDLCIHAWKQEAFSGVFLVACRILTPWQTNWEDFFSSFPGQSFGEFRAARGEGRFLEGIWGHLGRTSSVWQATEKSKMCSEAGRERHKDPVTHGGRV